MLKWHFCSHHKWCCVGGLFKTFLWLYREIIDIHWQCPYLKCALLSFDACLHSWIHPAIKECFPSPLSFLLPLCNSSLSAYVHIAECTHNYTAGWIFTYSTVPCKEHPDTDSLSAPYWMVPVPSPTPVITTLTSNNIESLWLF